MPREPFISPPTFRQGFPEFAVLLDMVGGEGAQFYREGMSVQYAPDVVNRVWNAAREAGFGSYFPTMWEVW